MKTYERVTLLKDNGNHKAGKTIPVDTATAENMEAKKLGKRRVKAVKATKKTTTKVSD